MKRLLHTTTLSTLLALTLQSMAGAETDSRRPAAPPQQPRTTKPVDAITFPATASTAGAVGRQRASLIAKQAVERRVNGQARVTGIEREDDHGAHWEVEVTTAAGREFDVYVDARGSVVKIQAKAAGRQQAGRIARQEIQRRTGKSARVLGIEAAGERRARWRVLVSNSEGLRFDVYLDAVGQVVRVTQVSRDPGGTGATAEAAAAAALAHIESTTGKPARVTDIGREDDFGALWEVEVTREDGFEYDVYVARDGRILRVVAKGFDN